MDIALECSIVIVGVLLSFGYLHLTKKQEGDQEKRKLSRPMLIYHGIMLVMLLGFIVGMNVLYPEKATVTTVKLVIVVTALFVLAWKDYLEYIIPNEVLLVLLGIRLPLYIWEFILYGSDFFEVLKDSIIALLVVGVFLVLVRLIVKNSIGMGDIKLLMLLGLYQGFVGMFGAVFLSLLVTCVFSIVLLVTKKKGRKDVVPFAPSVLFGTYISILLTGM